LQLGCNLAAISLLARMALNDADAETLFWLEQILAGKVDGTMSATILANLHKPEIQSAAKVLFGQTPTSIGELAKNIGIYLLPHQEVQVQNTPSPNPQTQFGFSTELADDELLDMLEGIPDSVWQSLSSF